MTGVKPVRRPASDTCPIASPHVERVRDWDWAGFWMAADTNVRLVRRGRTVVYEGFLRLGLVTDLFPAGEREAVEFGAILDFIAAEWGTRIEYDASGESVFVVRILDLWEI